MYVNTVLYEIILETFLLIKIIITLFYNMKNLYIAFLLQKSQYNCFYALKITILVVLQPKIGR